MAVPGHSPTRAYGGPGSPPRIINSYPESQLASSMYNHQRSMLPPSPQHYQPRFPPTSLATPAPPLSAFQDVRPNPSPYKRPGSSMSISSMLGGEPEKPQHESRMFHHARTSSQPASFPGPPLATNANTVMSPPHQLNKPSYGDYSYNPRSRTPERINTSLGYGSTRQRSSSSGMVMQRTGMFDEMHHRSNASSPAAHLHHPSPIPYEMRNDGREREERYRRTSLSGVLQRPSSQPQASVHLPSILDPHPPDPRPAPAFESAPAPEAIKSTGPTGTYDTKPPGMNGSARQIFRNPPSPPKSTFQSVSPDIRRPTVNGSHGRGLASILNGPTSQPIDPFTATSQRMSRQDSTHSQSDRSVFGDRTKFRAYSPFNSSFTSNPEDQGRKGSDELSQHRAILGLSVDSKRGRYSPLPQAVQGAQAQSPVPDVGVKLERGRVFSGLGGGIGTVPPPSTSPMPSSPFKRDEGPMRLSEDNLRSLARSTAGTNKRSRKVHDEERQGDLDVPAGEKTGSRKKGKHQHNYKAELEEMAQTGIPRRNGASIGAAAAKRTSTPSGLSSQPLRAAETPSVVFLPKKKISVAAVFQAAAATPRQHLGSYTYRPHIAQTVRPSSRGRPVDVSISPNLVPSFADAVHANCTYTIHVPRIWLQPRERGLICAAQHLWGSGVYTDDSDPVAAAIHAGFVKTRITDTADADLFAKVVHEQNPIVEFPSALKLPAQPLEIPPNKDLSITMVVLPLLEKYDGSTRFGLRSRTWPEGGARTPHDGVSFGILRVDFVNLGAEELRVGRTGQGRRSRLLMDIEGRRRGLQPPPHRSNPARERGRPQTMPSARPNGGTRPGTLPSPSMRKASSSTMPSPGTAVAAVKKVGPSRLSAHVVPAAA